MTSSQETIFLFVLSSPLLYWCYLLIDCLLCCTWQHSTAQHRIIQNRALLDHTEFQCMRFLVHPCDLWTLTLFSTHRGKLRDLLPSTSFSGGVYLNDTGYNLLSQLLTMDPAQVTTSRLPIYLFISLPIPPSAFLLPNFQVAPANFI